MLMNSSTTVPLVLCMTTGAKSPTITDSEQYLSTLKQKTPKKNPTFLDMRQAVLDETAILNGP